MGEDWRHTIVVEEIGSAEANIKYPRFVAGERRCPPEDVGGLPGFELLLDAMDDPAHEEHSRLLEWYGEPSTPETLTNRPQNTRSPIADSPARLLTKRAALATDQTILILDVNA